MTTTPYNGEEKKVGPIIGILIIVILLVFAALYFWAQKVNIEEAPANENPSANTISSSTTVETNTSIDAEYGLEGVNSVESTTF